MLMRFGQAALIAAMVALLGNGVWAQVSEPQGEFANGYSAPACCNKEKCCNAKECCESEDCCKDGKCGKDTDCRKSGKCCKSTKCDCVSGGDCCCKKGECNCKKSRCGKRTCCGCCAVGGKGTTIIVVMPSAMPMFGAHLDPMGMLPPMLTPPGMAMPPPTCCPCPMPSPACLPTPYVCAPPCKERIDPCLSLLSAACEVCSLLRPLSMPSLCTSAIELLSEYCPATYVQGTMPAPAYAQYPGSPTFPMPRELSYQGAVAPSTLPSAPVCAGMCPYGSYGSYGCNSSMTSGQLEVVPCAAAPMPTTCAKPVSDGKIRICAKPSGNQLEMSIGNNTCLKCKKLTVNIGDNEIALSRFDDRVRVHGDELKATADCVRSEGKDRLILEGDVVLHYKKDGHTANVSGDCIELNLSSGAVTIKPAQKTSR